MLPVCGSLSAWAASSSRDSGIVAASTCFFDEDADVGEFADVPAGLHGASKTLAAAFSSRLAKLQNERRFRIAFSALGTVIFDKVSRAAKRNGKQSLEKVSRMATTASSESWAARAP